MSLLAPREGQVSLRHGQALGPFCGQPGASRGVWPPRVGQNLWPPRFVGPAGQALTTWIRPEPHLPREEGTHRRGCRALSDGGRGSPWVPLSQTPVSLTLKLWDVSMLDRECMLTTMAHTILKVHRSE